MGSTIRESVSTAAMQTAIEDHHADKTAVTMAQPVSQDPEAITARIQVIGQAVADNSQRLQRPLIPSESLRTCSFEG